MKPLSTRSRILVVGLCGALLGCGDPMAPEPTSCTKNSTVVVNVSADSSPVVSWYPKQLLVGAVQVSIKTTDGGVVYTTRGDGNSLPSPVQLSVVPTPSFLRVDVICLYSDVFTETEYAKIIGTTTVTR
jgi:hypothetical protein